MDFTGIYVHPKSLSLKNSREGGNFPDFAEYSLSPRNFNDSFFKKLFQYPHPVGGFFMVLFPLVIVGLFS